MKKMYGKFNKDDIVRIILKKSILSQKIMNNIVSDERAVVSFLVKRIITPVKKRKLFKSKVYRLKEAHAG